MADDTLDLLKDLIQTCKDGETGYVHAAGVATDPQLKEYFSEQSLERARFGQELRAEHPYLGMPKKRWWFAAQQGVQVRNVRVTEGEPIEAPAPAPAK